jgi:DNA polymerase-3 subunit delta
MRLRPEQLEGHVAARGLPAVCLVAGDEPLQRREAIDAVRAWARQGGAAERLAYDTRLDLDWPGLAMELKSRSLFAPKRLFEVNLHDGKLGTDGGAGLVTAVENVSGDDALLLIADKLDKNVQDAAWFKAVDKAGIIVSVWPLSLERIPAWLKARMARRGRNLAADACSFIAARVEGNLLAAAQELEKLELLVDAPEITLQDVLESVFDSARFSTFAAVDEALAGHAARAVRMLRGLKDEGLDAMPVSWTLNRDIRNLAQMSASVQQGRRPEQVVADFGVWKTRQGCVLAALKRHAYPSWQRLLASTAAIDCMIKGLEPGDPWSEMEWLVVRLAMRGTQRHRSEAGARVSARP